MDYTWLFQLAWIIPLLPLISFLIVGFLGAKFSDKGGMIAIALVGAAMALSLAIAYAALTGGLPSHGAEGAYYTDTIEWVVLGSGFTLSIGIFIDTLTALMLIVVSFVATLVVIYSVGYMGEEGDRRRRYFTEISLFVGVMLGLVLASSFSLLFIFWELVGLCSYLLIGFWFERPSAASAAKKAFLVTRVGDVMFMIGLFILFNLFGTLNYVEMFDPEVLDRGRPEPVDLGLLLHVRGRHRKERSVPIARLVARCHGGSDHRLRFDPRRDDGQGRCLPGGQDVPAVGALL